MVRKFSSDLIFDGFSLSKSRDVIITDEKGGILGRVAPEDAGDNVEYHSGLLSPGFINCHCHLDLSHLRNCIAPGTGLPDFLKQIILHRESIPVREKTGFMQHAVQEMYDNGIVAVGDICTGNASLGIKKKSALFWRNFIEVTGFPEDIAQKRLASSLEVLGAFRRDLSEYPSTLSPHAPYSVSHTLMRLIAERTLDEVISIHSQECEDEDVLFHEGRGAFISLYESLSIDSSGFIPSGSSSLRAWLSCFGRTHKIIAVHNTFTTQEDLAFVKWKREEGMEIYHCLCPSANLYIENKLPPVPLLIDNNAQLVLGTDSLASNPTLDILGEMKILHSHFQIPPERLLQWATLNGAQALGIAHQFGSLEKGKTPGLVVLSGIDAKNFGDTSVTRLL